MQRLLLLGHKIWFFLKYSTKLYKVYIGCCTGMDWNFTRYGNLIFCKSPICFAVGECGENTKSCVFKVCTLDFIFFRFFVTFTVILLNHIFAFHYAIFYHVAKFFCLYLISVSLFFQLFKITWFHIFVSSL